MVTTNPTTPLILLHDLEVSPQSFLVPVCLKRKSSLTPIILKRMYG